MNCCAVDERESNRWRGKAEVAPHLFARLRERWCFSWLRANRMANPSFAFQPEHSADRWIPQPIKRQWSDKLTLLGLVFVRRVEV